ncbi:MAG TPA: hypothetical protein VFV92_07400 [Candidatus Bathyarchaeia archaeon]|nr:hypothetical protein [Candidatus Bathyarchaeia archaeon]
MKKYSSGTLLAVAVIAIVVVGAFGYYTNGRFTLSTTGPGPTSPAPVVSGFTAYCAGSTVTPAGVYPAGPGATAPAGCSPQASLISLTVQDLYNPGKALSNAYSCVFYWNAGSPATFTPTGPGVSISGGTWVVGPSVQASSTGVCAPTGWTPNTGTQVVVKVCIDSSATCVAGDYTNQKTVVYCPIGSVVPVVPFISGTSAPSQECNPGPGWGSVPYTTVLPSTAPTFYPTVPIIMIAGQNPTGSNSGYNTANPLLLDERYQNGTDFTAANKCLVNTGANACDLPKATSLGRFTMTWGLTMGGAGTAPANPSGQGFADTTPVELQGGTLARGQLQLVLSVEVKATANNDMCAITTPTLFGIAPVVISKSNSATDIFYLYVVPPTLVTKIYDPSGLPLNVGATQSNLQLDCNAVYNGSGDQVTITPIVYAYFSMSYFNYYHAAVLNPEASALSQSAVISVFT